VATALLAEEPAALATAERAATAAKVLEIPIINI
jgi:hypothetical protein